MDMHIYFGAGRAEMRFVENEDALSSYYFLNQTGNEKYQDWKEKYNIKSFFIDSGAFSAFTHKLTIDIDKYCYFLRQIPHDVCASLDVIGSAEGSYKNAIYMEDKFGFKALPVFHIFEDFKYLDMYCENFSYLGLGGLALGIHDSDRRKFLSAVFTKYPKMKFHGFGLTSVNVMRQYPWHSVDSTSYLQTQRYGNLNTPIGNFYVGDKKSKSHAKNHILNQEEHQIEELRKMTAKAGIDFDLMLANYEHKDFYLMNKFNMYLIKQSVEGKMSEFEAQPQLDIFGFNVTKSGLERNRKNSHKEHTHTPLTAFYKQPEVIEIPDILKPKEGTYFADRYTCSVCQIPFIVKGDLFWSKVAQKWLPFYHRCTMCNNPDTITKIDEVYK